MKAVVIGRPGVVGLREVPEPEPGPGDVLVAPLAGGICGTDVHILQGAFIGTYPVIPCHEFSGEILACGGNVTDLHPGDRVAVDPNIRCGLCEACRAGTPNRCVSYDALGVTRPGGFAEKTVVPRSNAIRILHAGPERAALAEPLACVLYGQSRLSWIPGSRALLYGAGPAGLLHILAGIQNHGLQWIVVDRDDVRLQRAMELGAFRTEPAGADLDDRLSGLSPRGFDRAVDATGNPEAVQSLFRHLAAGGEALLFGVYPRTSRMPCDLFDLFRNDWKAAGSFTYGYEFSQAVSLLDSGALCAEKVADMEIGLDQVPDMLMSMYNGARYGKVRVRMT